MYIYINEKFNKGVNQKFSFINYYNELSIC